MSTYQIDAPIGANYDASAYGASRQAPGFSASQNAQRFVQAAVRLFVRALAEYRSRKAARELQSFDDRLLRDIGISRDSIDWAVRHGREYDAAPLAREWASYGLTDPFRR